MISFVFPTLSQTLHRWDIKVFSFREWKNTQDKSNLMKQWAEINRKWRIKNEHLPSKLMFGRILEKLVFLRQTLICELQHTFFIDLRLGQIRSKWLLALFWEYLRSAACKFAYSAVCENTYASLLNVEDHMK